MFRHVPFLSRKMEIGWTLTWTLPSFLSSSSVICAFSRRFRDCIAHLQHNTTPLYTRNTHRRLLPCSDPHRCQETTSRMSMCSFYIHTPLQDAASLPHRSPNSRPRCRRTAKHCTIFIAAVLLWVILLVRVHRSWGRFTADRFA